MDTMHADRQKRLVLLRIDGNNLIRLVSNGA